MTLIEGEYSVIGGAFGGGGESAPPPPVIQPDSLRSSAIVELVEAICEGEIEGFYSVDPLQSVYLDETPLKTGYTENFKGVSVDYRLGTQSQTHISGIADDSSAATVSVNASVTNGSPVIRTIADTTIDAVIITVQLAMLMKIDSANGDRVGTSVSLSIEVKPAGGSWSAAPLKGRGVISGKTESPYERSYQIDLKSFGEASSYDIKVSRLSDNPGSGIYSAFKWESYTKLSYAKLRYPNTVVVRTTFDAKYFSSLPSRGYKLLGTKVKVPTSDVYNPVGRVYTGADWAGGFVTAWTRCPAWIFYDLVTNPRYGLGELVNPAYMDKWNLYTIAKRCDELVPDGLGGMEPRYSLDLYIQSDDDAKKVIMDIASAFDAMAFWSGSAIYTTQDSPKSVSALFVPGNVVGGKFTYAGSARQVRCTVALVQWNDPNDNYRIATEYVEDAEGIARYGYREKQVVAIGCTSRGQAHRYGKRILLTSRLETDSVSFSVGLDGISSKPGDIIRIADPLRAGQQRYGGRVKLGSTTTTILLDSLITLASSTTYKIAVIAADGTVVESLITNVAGTTDTIAVSPALTSAPESGAAWIVYSPLETGKLYRIIAISENQDKSNGFYSISAIQYSEEKYALIDSVANLPPLENNPYTQTRSVVPPSGVVVTDGTYVGLDGLQRFIDVSWSTSTDSLLRSHVLTWSVDNGNITEVHVAGQSYRINNPKPGTYKISLYAENLIGAMSSSIEIDYVLGELYAISAVSVTNLSLPSGTGEFTGRNAFFSWSTDADTVLGQSSFATGQGGQSPWFRDFEVRVFNGATLLRTEYVTENYYSYTFEKNVEDGGPRRSFTVKVRARDYYGRYSIEASLVATNPPPSNYGAVNLTAGSGQIFVDYLPPTDPDYDRTRIFASKVQNFTPDPTPNTGNMVNDTRNRVTSFPAATGTWYVKLQGIDEFGESGATYSTEMSIQVSISDIVAAVDGLLATPGRASDFVIEAGRFLVTLNDGTNAKTVFGVGSVNGVTQVGIKGDLLIDGTLYGRSIAANAITADKIDVTQLSAVSANMGIVTAGTLTTSPDWTDATGPVRVDISDSGNYPIWVGHGSKIPANAIFYIDKINGTGYFTGALSGATGTFSGSLTGGTIGINSGVFSVASDGALSAGNGKFTVAADGTLIIRDAANNTVFSSGTGTEWAYVNGKPAFSGFATLNQINSGNASTYIANGAIQNAQIANASILTANIVDASVSTLKIQDHAVSVTIRSSAADVVISNNAIEYTLISVTADADGNLPIELLFSCVMPSTFHVLRIRKDGVEVSNISLQQTVVALVFVDNPTAGSHTYSVTIAGNTGTISGITCSYTEIKK